MTVTSVHFYQRDHLLRTYFFVISFIFQTTFIVIKMSHYLQQNTNVFDISYLHHVLLTNENMAKKYFNIDSTQFH